CTLRHISVLGAVVGDAARSRLYVPPAIFFFFNDTAPTEIYTLSLHDALPLCATGPGGSRHLSDSTTFSGYTFGYRSEEHTSELQSLTNLVCRLLLVIKFTFFISYTPTLVLIFLYAPPPTAGCR